MRKRKRKKLRLKLKRKRKETSLVFGLFLVNLFLLGLYLFLFAKVQEINYLLQKKEKEKFTLERKVQVLENIFENSFPKVSLDEAKKKYNLTFPEEIKYLSLERSGETLSEK